MTDDPVELAIAVAFMNRVAADRESGSVRTLAEYQAQFRGYEDLIAREYSSLWEGGTPSSPNVGVSWNERAGHEDSSILKTPDRIGDYRIERELGRGGQGTVYLGVDDRLGRKVALKTLSAAWAASPAALLRFAKEARVLASLDHPGLCSVFEAASAGGLPFIAMRYIDGESLAERIAGRKELPVGPELAADLVLMEKTARATHAAHEAGVIHRDLKPGNILLDGEGNPVVLDFGLAYAADEAGGALTATGDLLGTPAYMAPEQTGDGTVDRRTDVHALGVVLFELLTGRRPFEGKTRAALLAAVRETPAPDPRRLNPAVSEDLRTVVAKALAKSPADRYATALAFADDLRRVRLFEPVAARPISAFGRLARWARRRPAAAGLGAVLTLGVPVLGVFAGWYYTNQPILEERRIAEELERELGAGFGRLITQFKPEPLAALVHFERAAAIRPSSLEAAAGAAFARLMLRNPAAALRGLDAFRTAHGASPAIDRLRADAIAQTGRTAEAAALAATLPPPLAAVDCFIEGVRAAKLAESAAGSSAEERAVAWFEAAIQRSPVRRRLYVERLATSVGRTKLAESAARAAATARLVLGGWEGEAAAGWALVRSDAKGAMDAFERAAKLNPDYAIETGLGAVFLESGRLEEAARVLKACAERRGDDATAFMNWSLVENERGDFETARKAAARAAALRPDVADFHYAEARALRRLDREADALESLRRAVKAEPSHVVARTELSRSLRILGDGPGALREARKATELDPKFAPAWTMVGDAAGMVGDHAGITAAYEEALKIEPRANYALWAANAHAKLGRKDDAAAFLDRCELLAAKNGSAQSFAPAIAKKRAELGITKPESQPDLDVP